jgi:regulator of protease activity HflC (stomatin/prohibitin superfamily)
VNGALEWIGKIAEWLGRFIPCWQILDSRQGGVKFRTLLLRDIVCGRWDTSLKLLALGPGLHFYWPAVTVLTPWVTARQSVNMATQTITTDDGHAIAVGGLFIFQIVDVLQILAYTWHPDDTIRGVASGAVHDVCSSTTWRGLQDKKVSGALTRELLAELRARLLPFGVEPIMATLTDFAPTQVFKVIQSTSSDG